MIRLRRRITNGHNGSFCSFSEKVWRIGDTKEVNFCPECGTVIADEQVNPDGTCERHGGVQVERRNLPCWFFRITKFADRLLKNHDWLNWSEVTQKAQKRWIGASEGAEVDFKIAGREESIRVFTTRPDTLFGATYMVLAPEHPLVDLISDPSRKEGIESYRRRCSQKTEEERTAETKEKTGIELGVNAINPVNEIGIPIFISDYVMMGYGTGAIMAVPCGDHRDFAFAKKFELPIHCIIDPDLENGSPEDLSGIEEGASLWETPEGRDQIQEKILAGEACWSGPGKTIDSGNDEVLLDGLSIPDAKKLVSEWLESKVLGKPKTNYRLRDWGISPTALLGTARADHL